MHPIYFTIGLELPLMIIPDTQAHLDGHTIITHTYHIYKQSEESPNRPLLRSMDSLGLNKNDNPDYMGYITFDVPGKVYSYTADGPAELESSEVRELIEHLNHFRDNPGLWPI
jgi:hypothetical protein